MTAADHLEVPRQHGLFNHHGIDLGDGTIAHYLEGREILRSSIEDFSNGSEITIINHKNSLSTKTTLRKALERLGEQDYNLLFNNCEHFACWCKTGYHKSSQIDQLLTASEIGYRIINKFFPKISTSGMQFVQKNIFNQETSENLTKELKKLTFIIKKLNIQLEKILSQLRLKLSINKCRDNLADQLILKGQSISDEIKSLERIKEQVNSLLIKKKTNLS
tara:strand:- start:150 stop:809 length:660 start_codon:yes stop_codon:yes gene_type:complete